MCKPFNRRQHFRKKTNGFSLIEAVISIGIAALVLNSFYASVSTNVELKARSLQRAKAAMLAKSLLDTVSVLPRLESGREIGSDGGGFSWVVEIEPLVADEMALSLPLQTPLYDIRVEVFSEPSDRSLYVLRSIKGAF